MGAFATQLEVAVKEMGFRQAELARRAGVVSPTQVSRYLNGATLPELPSLEAMLGIFPEHVRERLVTAYLLDHIPPSTSHLVTVQPATRKAANRAPAYGKASTGSELEKCLAWLEERAMKQPQIADAIIATVRAMRGDPLNLELDMNEAPVVREEVEESEQPRKTRAAAGS